jgi:hypothetical protein
VTIDQDRTLHVHIRLNLLRILEEDSNKGGAIKLAGQFWSDEIYTRKSAYPLSFSVNFENDVLTYYTIIPLG